MVMETVVFSTYTENATNITHIRYTVTLICSPENSVPNYQREQHKANDVLRLKTHTVQVRIYALDGLGYY